MSTATPANDPILDDGFMTVTVENTSLQIDLFEVNNKLTVIHNEHVGKAYHLHLAAVVALMVELGYPTVSQHCAAKFAKHVMQAMGDLAQKKEPSAEPPVSTASTSSV